jgi:hypothetical protein
MLDTVNCPVGGRRLEEDEIVELLLENGLDELELLESDDVDVELEEPNETSELEELDSLICDPTDDELVGIAADAEDTLERLESLVPESELVDEAWSIGGLLLELVEDSIGRPASGAS